MLCPPVLSFRLAISYFKVTSASPIRISIALRYQHRVNRACFRSHDFIFHLHRFENDQDVTCIDCLARVTLISKIVPGIGALIVCPPAAAAGAGAGAAGAGAGAAGVGAGAAAAGAAGAGAGAEGAAPASSTSTAYTVPFTVILYFFISISFPFLVNSF